MGRHGVGERNRNGNWFVDFYNEFDLVIGGTLFPHLKYYKEKIFHVVERRIRYTILQQQEKSKYGKLPSFDNSRY